MPWPLPALLAWAAGWLLWMALARAALLPVPALLAGMLPGIAIGLGAPTRWRAAIATAGFPLAVCVSLLASAWPAWIWLLALLPPAVLYPLRAWRDAPLYPTPPDALIALPAAVGAAPARVLDAGCGLGHGLRALRSAFPGAERVGIEWSRPLAWLARSRMRDAQVLRGDMWRHSWTGFDLVYLFQRPESMQRAWHKARSELRPDAWLVSLEFEVPGVEPSFSLRRAGARPVWGYRVPDPAAPGSTAPARGR